MMVWWLATAFGADWMEMPWRRATTDGVIELPAGEGLRVFERAPIVDQDGLLVPLLTDGSGWQVAPVPYSRQLSGPDDLRIARLDRRQERADIARWERRTAKGQLAERPHTTPAWSERLLARARAVDGKTSRMGMWSDLAAGPGASSIALDRPNSVLTRSVLPGETVELDVTGWLHVGVRTLEPGFTRAQVSLGRRTISLGMSGEHMAWYDMVWADAHHPFVVTGDDESAIELVVERRRLRGWMSLPVGSQPDAFNTAERLAQTGACPDFTPWLDDSDPHRAGWARVRAIECAEGAQLRSLVDPNWEGSSVIAAAVLGRSADLPDDVLLDWVARWPDVDPRLVARWLDQRPSSRSHGLAVFEQALTDDPTDRRLWRDRGRHAAVYTRRSRLLSDRDDDGMWTLAPDGEGLPRVEIGPEQGPVRFPVDIHHDELRQVVQWEADPGTVFYLDGEPIQSDDAVRLALEPGEHIVEVESGRLRARPGGFIGAAEGTGWFQVPMPASFQLPGLGASMDVSLHVESPADVVFDDGRVYTLEPGTHRLRAGAYARSFEVRGTGRVGAAGRIVRTRAVHVESMSAQVALAKIREATIRIDRGETRFRAERAAALAVLAHRRLAWLDVAELAKEHPDLHRSARVRVASVPVQTTARGPLDARAAMARGETDRYRALALLEAGGPVEAVVTGARTNDEEVIERALSSLQWRPLSRMDRGAGVEPRALTPSAPPDDLRTRVRSALLGAPWSTSDSLVLGEGDVDRISSRSGPLTVEIFARDVTLGRNATPLPTWSVDDAEPLDVVEVTDGQVTRIEVGSSLEIGPVPEGRSIVVRARDAVGVLAPTTQQFVHAVRGRSTVRLPDDRLVRVRVLDGAVRSTSPVLGTFHGDFVVHPEGRLVLEGTGAVQVFVSRVSEEDRTPDADVPDPVRPEATLKADLLGWSPKFPVDRTIQRGPSFRVQARGVVSRDGQFLERWATGEVEGRVMWADRKRWAVADAWVRIPGGLGGYAEGGLRSGRSFIAGRVFGSATWRLDAGEVGARLHARTEIGPKRAWVRAEVWPRVSFVSLQPRRVVDPRVWSRFRLIHHSGVNSRLSLMSEALRDLRLRAWLEARSNAGPSLDRAVVGVSANWLVHPRLQIAGRGRLERTFKDDFRADSAWIPWAGASIDRDWWQGDQRWMLFGRVDASARGDIALSLGLSVHWTRGRGLRDTPPTLDLFRAEREGR